MKSVGNSTVVGAYQRMAVPAVDGAKPAAPAAPVGHEPAPHAAQVSISAEARELAKSSGGDVDVQKVSHLKEQIRSGAYRVDSEQVASRLVDRLG